MYPALQEVGYTVPIQRPMQNNSVHKRLLKNGWINIISQAVFPSLAFRLKKYRLNLKREETFMFFKLLFIMTVISYLKVIFGFVKSHPQSREQQTIASGEYLSLGFSTVFHLMVMSISMWPMML